MSEDVKLLLGPRAKRSLQSKIEGQKIGLSAHQNFWDNLPTSLLFSRPSLFSWFKAKN